MTDEPDSVFFFLFIICYIDHMNAVAEAILSAKSEIYIKDWWLTPELVCVYHYLLKKTKATKRAR